MNKHFLVPIVASALGIFTLGIPGILYLFLGLPFFLISDGVLGTSFSEVFFGSGLGDGAWPLLILFSLIVPPLYIVSYLFFRKTYTQRPLLIRSLLGWYALAVLVMAISMKLMI